VIDGRPSLSVTHWPAITLWIEADVVLAVGTRLQPQQMNWGNDHRPKIIRVDIDGEEFDRQRRPEIGIVGDATSCMKALAGGSPRITPSATAAPTRRRDQGTGDPEDPRHAGAQIAYLEAIRAALPEDGILVDELTQMGYAARLAYPTYKPRTFLSPGYQGTLGWGYATSLGVKVAEPDTPVVSISGDGGFLFTAMEMSTAAQNNIGVVAVVFSDGAYGNVKRIQQQASTTAPSRRTCTIPTS
jgi:acetolactate synthase-1/2/3 large subunit